MTPRRRPCKDCGVYAPTYKRAGDGLRVCSACHGKGRTNLLDSTVTRDDGVTVYQPKVTLPRVLRTIVHVDGEEHERIIRRHPDGEYA